MESILALTSDKAILEEFRGGDNDHAATAFVRKYQNFVYHTALRYLKSEEDAYDASQEVFIKALKGIAAFRAESSLSTWLYRITVNVCTVMRRKDKLRTFFGLETVVPYARSHEVAPDQIVENKDFDDRFRLILDTLPAKQRETFVLRYFEELSYEEISGMLGTSVGGLKANYYQAVKKIAQRMQQGKDDVKV